MALRLRSGGIVNHELLKAVEQTPRTLFAPPQYQDEVYSKRLIPLECGSFMEGCDMAVRLLHCLNLKPGQRILEVGTGSGFTAAVMGRIAERVLTIEQVSDTRRIGAEKPGEGGPAQRRRAPGRWQRRSAG
jgi:protein-L-isoaspartate(D-aspartate) O-methyltransferase